LRSSPDAAVGVAAIVALIPAIRSTAPGCDADAPGERRNPSTCALKPRVLSVRRSRRR
jgi:hypothetical protein